MAARNIEVVIKVRDNASKKLNDLERNTKDAGKAAARSKTDWTKFNRTLFTATAMVAMLVRSFNRLQRSVEMGAELDRLDRQFSRAFGSKGSAGDFVKGLRNTTTATVDSMEAMRAAIAIKTSGIASSMKDVTNIIAQGATAAKMAGVDTTEGVKRVVKFYKSGSISALEFLNVLKTTDPALTAQLELMKKAGGAFGGTFSMQRKVAIGRKLLHLITRKAIKGERDLVDVTKLLITDFDLFRRTIGRFLGTALTPLILKFSDLFLKLTDNIENIRKTDKNMLFLIKTFTIGTGVIATFVGGLATLKISLKALAFGGLGLGKLIGLIVTLGGAFLAVTNSAESFMDRLSTFGAFFKGIYQLVTNFNRETGKAMMDTELMKQLEEKGILGLVKNIARVANLTIIVVGDFVEEIKKLAEWTDRLVGGSFKTVIDMLMGGDKPWSMELISDEQDAKVSRMMSTLKLLAGAASVKFAFGGLKNVFSNIFGKRPKGTATDPIFTAPITAAFTSSKGILGKIAALASTVKAVILAIGVGWIIGKLAGEIALAIANKFAFKNALGQKFNAFEDLTAVTTGVIPNMLSGGKYGITPEEYRRMYSEDYKGYKDKGIGTIDRRSKKTDSVSVPASKLNQEDYLNAIAERMGELEGIQRKQLEEAYKSALSPTGEGGSTITDEEFKRMAMAFKIALDSSNNLNDMNRKLEPTPSVYKSSRR